MSDLVRRLRDPAFGTETSERNLMNQAADRIEQLEAALREFCDRVDRGEVRSVKTYAKFKALLEERT
jgi:hypothetical protein